MGNEVTPDTDTESSLPTVGVVAALRELVEEIEEVLSARANGAKGGGLDECTGGLNGRFWQEKQGKGRTDRREVSNKRVGVGHSGQMIRRKFTQSTLWQFLVFCFTKLKVFI